MTRIINLGTSAFFDLQEATKKAKKAFEKFTKATERIVTKRTKKEKLIQRKISDLNVEICEFLFQEGLICHGCSLNPNNCEGSNCGQQMDAFFELKTKDEISKLCFKAIGDKFYNLSIRLKNELKK